MLQRKGEYIARLLPCSHSLVPRLSPCFSGGEEPGYEAIEYMHKQSMNHISNKN